MKNSILLSLALILFFSGCSLRSTECWTPSELTFVCGRADTDLDVEFRHPGTGTVLTRPAFWDGGDTLRVRFAPTETGIWIWDTKWKGPDKGCRKKGIILCTGYRGDLDIYRHGFVTATPGCKYMTYSDGTPFFYLGDAHWGMYREEIDSPGPNSGNTGALSHFKYIVDRRVEQGFTVYQSEPINAPFDVRDGSVDEDDIPGFREADRYYEHIAESGLVHANAELFFASKMTEKLMSDTLALENLARYWVARFGAYPVLWTLAQEIDNDFYRELGHQMLFDYSCNPWVKFAEYLHKYDCYNHPLSAHQENTGHTTVTGAGVRDSENPSGGGVSAFASGDVSARTGHNWWAVQWAPDLVGMQNYDVIRDYRQSDKPAVNYEGRYCYLWTKDFGARAQGWISFLSGFCGYGYGCIDMWLYKSTYDTDTESFDGIDTISAEDKARPWCESLEFESALQMGYMRKYLSDVCWWKLKPVFPDEHRFIPSKDNALNVYAMSEEDIHILYFYGNTSETGLLCGLVPDCSYTVLWFNPRTGEYGNKAGMKSDGSGSLGLPDKPDDKDWVLSVAR